MGCFYTGFDWRNRKNGLFKIGETCQKTPAQRLASLRQKDAFQCLGYLVLEGETHAQRLFIESYVRMHLTKEEELTPTKTDYFTYAIKGDKYRQAQSFADTALYYAKEACQMENITYTRGTKNYCR